MEDYELQKQLYKGKASLLYRAICKTSRTFVALKLYRKARLSQLNWYQVKSPRTSPPTSIAHPLCQVEHRRHICELLRRFSGRSGYTASCSMST